MTTPPQSFTRFQRRIGLDIGRAPDGRVAVHAVALRGARVRWHVEALLAPDVPLNQSLAAFLRDLPGRRRWPAMRIAVALGPSFVQLKRLPGLPPLSDRRELEAAVRVNAPRFFLRNGIPLVTSSLRIDGPGDAWGAAAERPVLEEIVVACRAAGVRLVTVVPTGAVLGAITNGYAIGDAAAVSTMVAWQDGTDQYCYTYTRGHLTASRRSPRVPAVDRPASRVVVHRKRQTTIGRAFAGAYGAAIAGRDETVAWHPVYDPSIPTSRRARVLAGGAFILALAAALVAPGMSATLIARDAAAHVRAAAARRRTALATSDSLTRVTAALTQVTAFAASRRPATFTLRELTTALPANSALLALRLDTAGGSVVALTPKTAAIVAALAANPLLDKVEVVGAVTRESVSGTLPSGSSSGPPRELERATVRFQFVKASP